MSKTYSIALKRNNVWYTNWYQYFSLDEINWTSVKEFCRDAKYQAYGYYYGYNSRNLTSARCRTILEEFNEPR